MPTKTGKCAICGAVSKLTLDHVPPKSVMADSPVWVERFASATGIASRQPSVHPGRWAPEFRSICARCNNDRLGRDADPALARFATRLRTWLRAAFELGLSLPAYASVPIQPALVARAVVGHLLAGDGARRSAAKIRGGDLNDAMRAYFLSGSVAIPPEIRVLVWPYPSSIAVVGKGIGHHSGRSGELFVMDILKFYPVAFGVVMASEMVSIPWRVALNDLSVGAVDETVTLHLPLYRIPTIDWPEKPTPSGFVLVHGPSVLSVRPMRQAT